MDPRIETSLARALETGDDRDFLERAAPALGLPGKRPRLDAAREMALAIAAGEDRGAVMVRRLVASEREEARIIAAAALAAAATKGRRAEPLASLQQLADDPRATVRVGVIDAVRSLLEDDVAATMTDLTAWTDGFLQAHIALEALTDRRVLSTVPAAAPLLGLLDAAFRLADDAPRAADRWQGVRVLRQGLPAQIAAFVGRFSELYAWVLERAAATRPETREVLEGTVEALERASFRRTDVGVLRAALGKSEKPPRDPSRIVHGTRKRGRR